jgi:hypothetical protein
MWRRETSLRLKRSAPLLTQEPGFATRLGTRIVRRFNVGNLSTDALGQSLELDVNTKDLDVALDSNAEIRDGILKLGGWDERFSGLSCAIKQENLIRPAAVENLSMPNKQSARIKQDVLMVQPRLQSIPMSSLSPIVIAATHTMISPTAVDSKDMHFPVVLGNRILFSQLLELPHIRTSIDPNLLATADYVGFLREVEIIKGVTADRCELLAVFRHIPIEIIAHLRFLAERNILVYKISTEIHRTQTRVHDLAAVRDNDSQEIHLIAHRTRYQTVFLN